MVSVPYPEQCIQAGDRESDAMKSFVYPLKVISVTILC
ncbi:hypothetical protein EC970259_3615 [Escherichia coli 99.0741]|nr:hypothetical protein EC970259_3615 [Escherichia coli 99.0741]